MLQPLENRSGPLTGLEFEAFILDPDGTVSSSKVDDLIDVCIARELPAREECSSNMLEFGTSPYSDLQRCFLETVSTVSEVIKTASKLDCYVYPLANYIGEFRPSLRNSGWYLLKRQIMGKDRMLLAASCAGFHFHYSLSQNAFNGISKFLHIIPVAEDRQVLLNQYNALIAADPAFITIMQSSPFFNGRYIAKDSRVLLYRGGEDIGIDGAYTGLREFGGLQPYVHSYEELIGSIFSRYENWGRLATQAGHSADLIRAKNRLDYAWNPVKINKLGTVEYRGMDMNYPTHIIGASLLLKFLICRVSDPNITILPCAEGIKDPFKLEDNVLFVPQVQHLQKSLQYEAARNGFEDREVSRYVKALYKFVKPQVPKRYKGLLNPVKRMCKKEMSVSDGVISDIRRRGYSRSVKVPQDVCAELAIKYSERLEMELPALHDRLLDIPHAETPAG